MRRQVVQSAVCVVVAGIAMCWPASPVKQAQPDRKPVIVLKPAESKALIGDVRANKGAWHPPHQIKVWTATHKGRTFRVTQMPRCEHLETLITYEPSGETLKQAQSKVNGVAACTGSFHHPQSMALADFLQRKGAVLAASRTERCFVSDHDDGKLAICRDYDAIKGKPGVNALALGQSLVPFDNDGFSKAFMNRQTDRMAIGYNNNFVFIVQGKSDIWRLANFMDLKLPVNRAVNSDGGHVVRGKAPVHIVFRWKTAGPASTVANAK